MIQRPAFERSILIVVLTTSALLPASGCQQSGVREVLTAADKPDAAIDAPRAPNKPVDAGSNGIALPDAPAPAVDAPSKPCTPISCTPTGGNYCGPIGDGCGGVLVCPSACPDGLTCGGGEVKGLCGKPIDPNCVPISCYQPGGQLCGRVGDGCGRALECGTCEGSAVCGATTPNVCSGSSTPPPAGCNNLCNQQVKCPTGTTRVTGIVRAPTPTRFGTADPLYNAVVYVPNAPVLPFTPGVSCDRCGVQVSGHPLVSALSGPDGSFVLENVPAGTDIPLVIQIGRWRRQVKIPQVMPCQTTTLPAELTRLPRNQTEGDIPLTAIATGPWDPLECLLRKIGIEDSEFTHPTGKGRIHMYEDGGLVLDNNATDARLLYGDINALKKYDMVLLPCGHEELKLDDELKNMQDYTAIGGRLFLTDWSYSWLRDGGPFESRASWSPDLDSHGENFVTRVDQTFPKGKALAQWLDVVKGAMPTSGQVRIHDPFGGGTWYEDVNPPTQRWLYTEAPLAPGTQIFSFNTPVEVDAPAQCGRIVYSTFHVVDEPNEGNFPKACVGGPLTPQEKVLEFMLFDVASCVQSDKDPPSVFRAPPPAPPPPPPVVN